MGAFDKKMYLCENPSCGRSVAIRSTIKKEGEFKGKKVCSSCKQRIDGSYFKSFKPKASKIENLSSFFEQQINLFRSRPICMNCGCKIDLGYMPHANIAHILPKQKYKSVTTNKWNVLLLCAGKNDNEKNNCHYQFDNNLSGQESMPVWAIAKDRFNLFKKEVTETKGDDYLKLENVH